LFYERFIKLLQVILMNFMIYIFFLVFRCIHASLYEDLSVRRSVRRSIRWSVRPSVHPSVTCFYLIAEIDWKKHRITRKDEIWIPDCIYPVKNL